MKSFHAFRFCIILIIALRNSQMTCILIVLSKKTHYNISRSHWGFVLGLISFYHFSSHNYAKLCTCFRKLYSSLHMTLVGLISQYTNKSITTSQYTTANKLPTLQILMFGFLLCQIKKKQLSQILIKTFSGLITVIFNLSLMITLLWIK